MLERLNNEFFIFMGEGGWILWCLVGLAFGIAFSLLTIWRLLRFPEGRFLGKNDWHCLLERSSRFEEVLAVLRNGLGESEIEARLGEVEEEIFSPLEKRIPFALVLIGVAPLVGLLGTVSGMYTVFDGMHFSSSLGPTSIISKGISEALITTQMGLVISIPAFIVHNSLRTRYERLLNGFHQVESVIRTKT